MKGRDAGPGREEKQAPGGAVSDRAGPASSLIERRPCRRCGMVIELVRGPNGKTLPLQRVRTVYTLDEAGELAVRIREDAPRGLFVSHFETCPHARDFSRAKRS